MIANEHDASCNNSSSNNIVYTTFRVGWNVEDAIERKMMNWSGKNRAMIKDTLMLGYSCFAHGARTFYEETYAKGQDTTYQQRVEELKQRVEAAEREKDAMRAGMDAIVKDRLALELAACEAEKRALNARLDAMTKDIEGERVAGEAKVRRVEEEAKADRQRAIDLEVGRREAEIRKGLEATCVELTKALHEKELGALKLENKLREEVANELGGLKGECAKFQQMYEDAKRLLEERVGGVVERSYEGQMADLRRAVEEREMALALLRKSNAGKGVIGEGALSAYLRRHFNEWEVVDKGKVKHSCDLWMRRPDGKYIAIESKYKETVTRADGDKFTGDVDYMACTEGETFLAALFVSIRTRNIPGKGELHIEFRKGRPVMYVGLDGEDELHNSDFLKQCVVLLCKIAEYQMSLEKQENDAQRVLERMKPLLGNVTAMRKGMEHVKAANKKILDSVSDMEKEVNEVFAVIHEMVCHLPDVMDESGMPAMSAMSAMPGSKKRAVAKR